mgnify:FL=1
MMFPALFTEEASLSTAIERSWRLTDRAFWRTFAVILLAWVLARVLEFSLETVFLAGAWIFPGLSVELRFLVSIAIVSVMVQVVQPLTSIAVTLLYFDLRVRKEAFDLEVMAHQLSLPEGIRS